MPRNLAPNDLPIFKIEVLRALSDHTRQKIIFLLGEKGPLCVNEIASFFPLKRPTVSHHLAVLRRAGILRSVRKGKEIYYSLNKPYIKASLLHLLRVIESIPPARVYLKEEQEKEEVEA